MKKIPVKDALGNTIDYFYANITHRYGCKEGEVKHEIVKDSSPKNFDVKYCKKCGYVPLNGIETVRSNEGIQSKKGNGAFKTNCATIIDFKAKQIIDYNNAKEANERVRRPMVAPDLRMMKEAWALTQNAGWSDGEKETIKQIPDLTLKVVLGRIKSNPNMKADAYAQCGWKFSDELKSRGINME